jgi:hypothetical protein
MFGIIKRLAAVLALMALSSAMQAQEVVNGGITILGSLRANGSVAAVDFTSSGATSPVKSGTLAARPATCAVGQMYFSNDATPGQNLSLCTSANTWTTISGAGSAPGAGVNTQSGTSYTVADSDKSKLVTFSNASSVAVTLPQAGASGWFVGGWDVYLENRGAGTVTVTATSSTIDGVGSLPLAQNSGVRIVSDGINYFTVRGMGGAGGGAVSSVAGKTGAVTLLSSDLSDVTVPTITPGGNATVSTPLSKCLDKTVSYSADLSQASQTYSVALGTFPAHWVFTDAWVRETSTFASSTITTLTASIGPSGSETAILPAVTLKQSPNVVSGFPSGYTASDSATPIVAQFVVTAGSGNLNTLTAGTWDVRVCGHAGR